MDWTLSMSKFEKMPPPAYHILICSYYNTDVREKCITLPRMCLCIFYPRVMVFVKLNNKCTLVFWLQVFLLKKNKVHILTTKPQCLIVHLIHTSGDKKRQRRTCFRYQLCWSKGSIRGNNSEIWSFLYRLLQNAWLGSVIIDIGYNDNSDSVRN